MVTKHILAHVGVAAVGVGALLLFGVPTATAIPLALVLGCAVMMVMMVSMMGGGTEHGDPKGPAASDASRRARAKSSADRDAVATSRGDTQHRGPGS